MTPQEQKVIEDLLAASAKVSKLTKELAEANVDLQRVQRTASRHFPDLVITTKQAAHLREDD
jgi:hypothetical protein